eukprot:scaffold3840_cov129-Cylindrotheca_fusiformis.AAC.1
MDDLADASNRLQSNEDESEFNARTSGTCEEFAVARIRRAAFLPMQRYALHAYHSQNYHSLGYMKSATKKLFLIPTLV